MPFLRNIFSKKTKPAPDRAGTAPLDPSRGEGWIPSEGRQHVSVGASHSLGLERTQDDDALLVFTGGADSHDGLLDFGLFCVADGLGGYDHGNLASSIAVRTVAHRLTQGVFLRLFELEPEEEDQPLEEAVREAFMEANQAVSQHAFGGATTLTAALMLGGRLMIGHVGDTRAYFINEDKVEVLTRDQSLVQQLIEAGALNQDEVGNSPHRSVLWNAMGKTGELQVDVVSHAVLHNGYLLLCSDGLWAEVSDDEIQRIIYGTEDPQTACDTLIQAAHEAGGSDNITAVLLLFPPKL